jgi:hypothetical protein
MIRLFPSAFAQLLAPLAAPADSGCVRARLGLALRFCAAAVLGVAVVAGSLVVWAVAALLLAVVGDEPPRRSDA